MRLEVMESKHYKALYEIQQRAKPNRFNAGYDEFVSLMEERQGYVVVANDGRLAGYICFSDYDPGLNILIHCTIDPEFQGRWAIKRDMYRDVFSYPFVTLDLPRVSSYSIEGVTDKAGRFLEGLGFKLEGIIRNGAKGQDGALCNVRLYGLLKEEARW